MLGSNVCDAKDQGWILISPATPASPAAALVCGPNLQTLWCLEPSGGSGACDSLVCVRGSGLVQHAEETQKCEEKLRRSKRERERRGWPVFSVAALFISSNVLMRVWWLLSLRNTVTQAQLHGLRPLVH